MLFSFKTEKIFTTWKNAETIKRRAGEKQKECVKVSGGGITSKETVQPVGETSATEFLKQ